MGVVEVILLVVLFPFFFCFWTVIFILLIVRAVQKAVREKFNMGKKDKKDREGERLEDVV